jgi:transcriptional regulator with XRE-family HTH domain
LSTPLAQTLKRLKINRTRLAKELGISKQALYQYINGDNDPSIQTFRKLLKILEPMGVKAWDIMPESKNEVERL